MLFENRIVSSLSSRPRYLMGKLLSQLYQPSPRRIDHFLEPLPAADKLEKLAGNTISLVADNRTMNERG